MLKVHHVRLSRSVRVLWLLEELGEPYEVVERQFIDGSLKGPDHLRVHPLGQVPALEDGDTVLLESGAIVEYLAERSAALAPRPGEPLRASYLQWLHFGEATLMRPVTEIIRARFSAQVSPAGQAEPEDEARASRARAQLGPALELLEDLLSTRPFVCGESFTAADVMVGYALTVARMIGELPRPFERLSAYCRRLKARPAFIKAWS